MIHKFLSPSAVMGAALTALCLFALPPQASAQNAKMVTVTDLKQNMGKNHFWMTMRNLPAETANVADSNGNKPANKCLLTYIEKPRFRKKINLALILSAEKDRLFIQSGSAGWHLKQGQKGVLDLKAGHWIHHFNMKASKENEITAQMPEEEMRSLLNTLSRNIEGTIEFSSGKSVRLPLKNIAPEINDFKQCARSNHLADLGSFVPVTTKKGLFQSKEQASKSAPQPTQPF